VRSEKTGQNLLSELAEETSKCQFKPVSVHGECTVTYGEFRGHSKVPVATSSNEELATNRVFGKDRDRKTAAAFHSSNLLNVALNPCSPGLSPTSPQEIDRLSGDA
jgi:hypothetical protein